MELPRVCRLPGPASRSPIQVAHSKRANPAEEPVAKITAVGKKDIFFFVLVFPGNANACRINPEDDIQLAISSSHRRYPNFPRGISTRRIEIIF